MGPDTRIAGFLFSCNRAERFAKKQLLCDLNHSKTMAQTTGWLTSSEFPFSSDAMQQEANVVRLKMSTIRIDLQPI